MTNDVKNNTITNVDLINLPAPSRYTGPKGIPLAAIVELKEKQLTNSQIAKILGCHPSNISIRCQEIETTKKYVENKAFLIRHLERRVYDNFTDAKLKKANAQQLGILYGTIYDKGQLEEGGSTQNVMYADAIKARDQHKMDLDKLREIHKQRHETICQTEET
jgi:hypothetical protein